MYQEHQPSKLTLLSGTDPWLFMFHQVQGLICTATQKVEEKNLGHASLVGDGLLLSEEVHQHLWSSD